MRKRDMVMYGVALVLAFVVGVLVGGQCAAPSKHVEPVPVVVECDPLTEVVYECPPEQSAPVREVKARNATKPPKRRALPKAAPPITPKQRKRLLAWVRDQSVDLEGCRASAKETYRMSVTLALDDDGTVNKVGLNAPASEVPASVKNCLRARMREWSPPAELVRRRRALVFGLTL